MMKKIITILIAAAFAMTACVDGGQKTNDAGQTTSDVGQTTDDSGEVTGVVGDGTSMHALELITLDTGDSLYFTFEVSQNDGIEIGDTVRVTYDYQQGDEAAIKIEKLN